MNWEEKLKKQFLQKNPCMNNTKWREFAELIDNYKFGGMKIKFLLDDIVVNFYGFGVIENSYCDCMNGAFYYKEIEWIFIPKIIEKERFNRNEKLKSEYKENEVDEMINELNALGIFPYDVNEEGITIYGYK